MNNSHLNRLVLTIAAIAAIAAVLYAVAGGLNTNSNTRQSTNVAEILDGDTFVMTNGTHVRLIGIDTPEIEHPDQQAQCYSAEAEQNLSDLIEGKMVRLELDKEHTDAYGRTLAYVYVGTTFVNAAQAQDGYARYYDFPPNTAHMQEFHKLVYSAIDAKKGLWGACPDAMQWATGS